MTDEKDESCGDFLKRVGTDGHKWAQEFMKKFGDKKEEIDEALMIGWFCNAIESGVDNSTEIISLKEKYWREQFLEAESNLFKCEGNVRVNKMLIVIATEEVEKEAKKNAR